MHFHLPGQKAKRPCALLIRWLFIGWLCSVPFAVDARGQDIQQQEEDALWQAAQEIAPSTVRIETFAGVEAQGNRSIQMGPTTGLVVSSDGYILSSGFNFLDRPASILIQMGDDRYPAELVAKDNNLKLVLLKIEPKSPLNVPEFLSQADVRVGQWAVAVGRAYDANDINVSVGIVSAKHRVWGKAVQTDAKISPNNYGGPLVDLQGRVIGVLAPLSPQSQTQIAGAEWYDSGIGFAVPVDRLLQRLEQLQNGEDLSSGLMGVSLKSSDLIGPAPEIVNVLARSPADAAGLETGDVIIRANQIDVRNYAQLKHVVEPLYAGDTLELTVRRDDQELTVRLELTDKLEPFAHGFLGILPSEQMEDVTVSNPDEVNSPDDIDSDSAATEESGVGIRFVYPTSPLKDAVQPGDRILKIAGEAVRSADECQDVINGFAAGDEVDVDFERSDQTQTVTVELASVPDEIPSAVPERIPANDVDADQEPSSITEIQIPEEAAQCQVLVPASYDGKTEFGLLVWIQPPGPNESPALQQQWQEWANSQNLIVLCPQSAAEERWEPTETAFIKKTVDSVLDGYQIDDDRVVVAGTGAGATMAYLFGFENHSLVKGIAALGAAVPLRQSPPMNEPADRLAFLMVSVADSPIAARIESDAQALRKLRFPVTVLKQSTGDTWDDERKASLAKWIDSLDRF
ncbi:MAG: PDZ domain-containing protein [Pirellulaceae bacterium]